MLLVRLRISSSIEAELSKLASELVIITFLPRLSSRAAACASMLDATMLEVRKIASENPMIMITPMLLTGFLLTFPQRKISERAPIQGGMLLTLWVKMA